MIIPRETRPNISGIIKKNHWLSGFGIIPTMIDKTIPRPDKIKFLLILKSDIAFSKMLSYLRKSF
ncbi:MAG: hypothetical protein AUF74_01575 [Thaumarchaeota archaeon 13_1_20CM_2_38_5]|nr:MAG: hypothetical protein AUI59_03260 [Thaumarchaeota archaeon 13_1_40CM_2_39_13_1]OLE39678.1 MAG: hypothetical protein AUF74_01575 [Thaumarchaeota archaeon 13_1_20CM_2_38_5]